MLLVLGRFSMAGQQRVHPAVQLLQALGIMSQPLAAVQLLQLRRQAGGQAGEQQRRINGGRLVQGQALQLGGGGGARKGGGGGRTA